jgi:hypothetical protein
LPLPHLVEHGFDMVREARYLGEAKGAARPLDRMGRTENGVHQLGVVRLRLEFHQSVFKGRQVLGDFFEERGVKFLEV